MTRRKDITSEPRKFLGHGICDNLSRSLSLPTPTDDCQVISKSCMSLLRALHIPACDLRGMGIQVTKLSDISMKTSTTKSMLHYTKVITPLDLHRQDEAATTKPRNNKEVTGATSTTGQRFKAKSQSITSFLDSSSSKTNQFAALSPVKLPPLPCISLVDPDEPGPSTVATTTEVIEILVFFFDSTLIQQFFWPDVNEIPIIVITIFLIHIIKLLNSDESTIFQLVIFSYLILVETMTSLILLLLTLSLF